MCHGVLLGQKGNGTSLVIDVFNLISKNHSVLFAMVLSIPCNWVNKLRNADWIFCLPWTRNKVAGHVFRIRLAFSLNRRWKRHRHWNQKHLSFFGRGLLSKLLAVCKMAHLEHEVPRTKMVEVVSLLSCADKMRIFPLCTAVIDSSFCQCLTLKSCVKMCASDEVYLCTKSSCHETLHRNQLGDNGKFD